MADNIKAVFTNIQENRFWLQILGDYARILYQGSSPAETAYITQISRFIVLFDELSDRSRQNLTDEQLTHLNRDSLQATNDFRQFLFNTLRRQMAENYYTGLLPIILSRFLSCADLYEYILEQFLNKREPKLSGLYIISFWMPIIIVYSTMIGNSVGIFFYEFRQKAGQFSARFTNNFIKALEMSNIINLGIPNFPLSEQFMLDVYNDMSSYAEFIVDMIHLVQANRTPSVLSLEYLDHIYRLLCYFETQLSVLLNKPKPACDPTALRLGSI
jgi:hypothetical protein